ncbi:Na+/H+ antiporter NhaC family protein [Pseudoflavonifractor sp. An184]|uniref:Na+/H+ antiporter NhaC family protein n=1 Tax=Pseudoflavonifractor sp. An184 TaxID=1965576 RepID=UPI000B38C6FD|nr:Na+/H+ antiporter NhaC family protein [Pseudoflavonifractor sp. An184]OUP47818.1 sodium:proton antiporter [Pseudoflavonifractor sp. An184]
MRRTRTWLPLLAVLVLVVMAMTTGVLAAGEEAEEFVSPFYATPWALLPPVVAIGLALITKEVYSSLFIGILVGGLLYSGFNFEGTVLHVFEDGIVSVLSDSYNVGILVFLVILGAMVCLMNKAGGSAAFGRWAAKNIKSRVGAQMAAIVLGVLIFIDDYFNCLTVGSVMRPITDKHRVSRVKLAYVIDATAAPVCIIAPISSWAAAVSSYVPDGQGLAVFIRAIPYNFYALFTIAMMIAMVLMKVEFGPMLKFERNAIKTGDLFSGSNPYAGLMEDDPDDTKGAVADLVLPIVVLIVACVTGMLYSGSFFDAASENYLNIPGAFSSSDASIGLMLGSSFGLLFALIFYWVRKAMTFKQMMECIPEGFKAMVPAIMILTFAWSLKAMTDSLGATPFVEYFVNTYARSVQFFLPAIVFAIGCLLAFATGTSWGTFGILIPITMAIFPLDNPLGIICISASMAGAVCGDHCSPISDTTIMASAGAQCDHVNHVSTQLPYAIVCAAIAFVSYVVAGLLVHFGAPGILALPFGLVLLLGFLVVMKRMGDDVTK